MWVRELPSKDELHWPETHGAMACVMGMDPHGQINSVL
jgi:hypothetical protein